VSSCPSCTRALQVALHKDYRDACPACQIRKLAHMPQEKRERQLDLLTHLCGPGARARVQQELRVELARIRKLRGGTPHSEAKRWPANKGTS
jgi:hypothetical protein